MCPEGLVGSADIGHIEHLDLDIMNGIIGMEFVKFRLAILVELLLSTLLYRKMNDENYSCIKIGNKMYYEN